MSVNLIVNADDFGLSNSISDGIVECYVKGIVTSTSLMVNEPGASHAAKLAKENPKLDIGLHFSFETWECLLDRSNLESRVLDELDQQFNRFTKLLNRKPTHIDVHRSLPIEPVVAFALQSFTKHKQVILRSRSNFNTITGFYGFKKMKDSTDCLTVKYLKKIINNLEDSKTNILICHPGKMSDKIIDIYTNQRELELAVLTDNALKPYINDRGVKLVSFSDLYEKTEKVH